MIRIKQDPDALDLTNHSHSPIIEHDDDDEENFSNEDDTHDCIIPKKTSYDSGFVDTSDVNNSSIMIKQEQNHHHHYHSTPLRPQQIHKHIRHPSTSSSACSSPTRQEQSNDKECRNTRFLGSRAVSILNQWFQLNREYPYPDDERTEQLANEAGITQKQVKKWFANKRVRSQMCYKPLYRSRKTRNSTSTIPERHSQTNYNYIINHNNIATTSTNPMLFNPMATSMMMFMMQQHFLTTMMTTGFPQPSIASPLPPPLPPPPPPPPTSNVRKPNVDRITRFWL
ncbi:unnamed protein product [Rotaria sp. Silwood1]|nr:unnamed protein product [Rotaria sp. Silwood1]CAF3694249.1 unnamed protein product [Rotaria sp. Silwood1]CAF3736315.1 unnamed protein product [Rotaria sp. Silwood1]CAF4814007.1 unnamed protein product [Rotaria sp. Silwood1]CAF5079159.1 unnamed protein product [Rotaria sp. Silwood1]